MFNFYKERRLESCKPTVVCKIKIFRSYRQARLSNADVWILDTRHFGINVDMGCCSPFSMAFIKSEHRLVLPEVISFDIYLQQIILSVLTTFVGIDNVHMQFGVCQARIG